MTNQLLTSWSKDIGYSAGAQGTLQDFAYEVSKHAMLAATEFSEKVFRDAPLDDDNPRGNFKTRIMMLALSKALFTHLTLQRIKLGQDTVFSVQLGELILENYGREYAATSSLVSSVWKQKNVISTGDFDPLQYITNKARSCLNEHEKMDKSTVEIVARTMAGHFYPMEQQTKAYTEIKKAGYLIAAKFLVRL